MKLLHPNPLGSLFILIVAVQGVTSMRNDPLDVIRQLKSDPDGLKHVGDDGILRSYDGNGSVIDYARFDQDQLMAIAGWAESPEEKDHLKNLWKNVTTLKVEENQIWAPPPHLRPAVSKEQELYPQLRDGKEGRLASFEGMKEKRQSRCIDFFVPTKGRVS
ncbi:hypothetical protein EMCG_02610 [[Emmonsia] crescens]|uniref:Uncharacterized protein n=1 Tax=[Emmonsia] crescens TaxID=73230 RepID=A0A0G2HYZ5_9EURO|nr:hypothetical protein EMCG_02610 [Emmonsia crescens UAMH 3008]